MKSRLTGAAALKKQRREVEAGEEEALGTRRLGEDGGDVQGAGRGVMKKPAPWTRVLDVRPEKERIGHIQCDSWCVYSMWPDFVALEGE